MTLERQIALIIGRETGLQDVGPETRLDWQQARDVNDTVCIQLNLNIGTIEAMHCRTVGDYIELVRSKS
ncbi:hypothetical protein [Corticibacter populi]|nr:hypothetical protein [Corticibacter populi]